MDIDGQMHTMGDGRRNLDVNCMVLHGHRVHVLDQQS